MSLLLQEDRGAVRVLTMNRPQKRNALNTEAADLPLAEALAKGREANQRMRSFRKS